MTPGGRFPQGEASRRAPNPPRILRRRAISGGSAPVALRTEERRRPRRRVVQVEFPHVQRRRRRFRLPVPPSTRVSAMKPLNDVTSWFGWVWRRPGRAWSSRWTRVPAGLLVGGRFSPAVGWSPRLRRARTGRIRSELRRKWVSKGGGRADTPLWFFSRCRRAPLVGPPGPGEVRPEHRRAAAKTRLAGGWRQAQGRNSPRQPGPVLGGRTTASGRADGRPLGRCHTVVEVRWYCRRRCGIGRTRGEGRQRTSVSR